MLSTKNTHKMKRKTTKSTGFKLVKLMTIRTIDSAGVKNAALLDVLRYSGVTCYTTTSGKTIII